MFYKLKFHLTTYCKSSLGRRNVPGRQHRSLYHRLSIQGKWSLVHRLPLDLQIDIPFTQKNWRQFYTLLFWTMSFMESFFFLQKNYVKLMDDCPLTHARSKGSHWPSFRVCGISLKSTKKDCRMTFLGWGEMKNIEKTNTKNQRWLL